MSGDDETVISGSSGFYKGKKSLTVGSKYTLQFWAKGNENDAKGLYWFAGSQQFQ